MAAPRCFSLSPLTENPGYILFVDYVDKALQIVFYSNHKIENCNIEMSAKIKVRDQACASNGFCFIKLGARNLGTNN